MKILEKAYLAGIEKKPPPAFIKRGTLAYHWYNKGRRWEDLFGNKKPVHIETDEWWFNGRIIQKQDDDRLPTWISFADNDDAFVEVHEGKKDAIKYALLNPCRNPNSLPKDYI